MFLDDGFLRICLTIYIQKIEGNKLCFFYLKYILKLYWGFFLGVRSPGFPGVFRDGLTPINVGVNIGFGDQKVWRVDGGFQKKSPIMVGKYPFKIA